MQFRRREADAKLSTRWLVILFMLLVLGMVLITNVALAAAWKLIMLGGEFPDYFFSSNTFLVLLYVFGSCYVEALMLKKGGVVLAERAGAIALNNSKNMYEKRLLNVVMEVAVATGLRPPKVYLLRQEVAINAFAAGWDTKDAVIAVTQGAIERLTRDELQGVVAHEYSHIINGDMRLNMTLMSMVFGLQMLYNYGQSLVTASHDYEKGQGFFIFWAITFVIGKIVGYALMTVGWLGWLAGAILCAGVSRQREYLADASAVKYTRLVDGIAGALRKIAYQQNQGRDRLRSASNVILENMAPLFLHFEADSKWFATHPSIAERLKQLGQSYTRFEKMDKVEKIKVEEFNPVRLLADGELTPHLKMAAARWGGSALVAQTYEEQELLPPIDLPKSNHVAQMRAEIYLEAEMSEAILKTGLMAFLVPPNDQDQKRYWEQYCKQQELAQIPSKVLMSVQNLAFVKREPFFEMMAVKAQVFSQAEREELGSSARQFCLHLNKPQPIDWLRSAVLVYWMGEFRESMSNKYQQLQQVQEAVVIMTSFMAQALVVKDPEAWTNKVLSDLGLSGQYWEQTSNVQRDIAIREIHDGVSSFAPILIKAWMQQWKALAAQQESTLRQQSIDIFRLMSALLDTICPQEIQSHYDA